MSDFNHEAVENAELSDEITRTTAAEIAGELNLSDVKSIKTVGFNADYRVNLEVSGGFFASQFGNSRYAITSVIGKGNPETVSIDVVEKNY